MSSENSIPVKIKFGKIFWPALLAVSVVSFIGWLVFFFIIGGIAASVGADSVKTTQANTVLHLTLKNPVQDAANAKLDPTSFSFSETTGLSALLVGFENAKKDPKVKGIFIEIDDLNCGYGNTREIRNAINDFEKSGKFTIAYSGGEYVSLKELYLATAANEVYGFPTTNVEFLGLGTEYLFFKNTLERLEVEMQVIRGKNNDFKSAVEPYFLDKMSDSSRVQTNRYLSSIWSDIRTDIGKDRNIDANQLNMFAEKRMITGVDKAVDLKLMDGAIYKDEVEAKIRKKLKLKAGAKIPYFSFEDYAQTAFESNQNASSPTMAVIMAEGEVSVNGDELSSKKICKYLKEARETKTIKTVVLRVNSPGGSALASDEIWREVVLTNKVKKVIVSMGNLAASGGYYISAPASYIFAERTTITGSIGVFGVIPFTGKMLENKLGVTFDRVGTNSSSVMSTNRKLSPEEMLTIQNEVDGIYGDFLSRVATGRKKSMDYINQIARGRVWTGADALKIGLVDQLGGLNDAIAYAKKEAKLKNAVIKYWPKVDKSAITELLKNISKDDEAAIKIASTPKISKEFLGYLKQLEKMQGRTGILMRLPFDIVLN